MENTISLIFRLLASAVSLYGTICFIRIIITWIPSINYSSIGSFLSQLCDPYLYIFAKFPLRVGMLDFTPVISLGLLTLVSSILNDIARSGKIYIGGILKLSMVCWFYFRWNYDAFILHPLLCRNFCKIKQ